jgi:hypothetical protein
MVKFTLNKSKNPNDYWNGKSSLPDEINVMSYHPIMSEFELLSIISTLHGYLTAFDILTGANTDTEKDKDINSVITAFQMYNYPKMPLSNYSSSDKRLKNITQDSMKPVAIESNIIPK